MDFRIIKLLLFLTFSSLACVAMGQSKAPQLVGTWQYYKILYKGQMMAPLDPDLIMTYQFDDSDLNTIKYQRLNQEGFCERTAQWSMDPLNEQLHQTVVAVNPGNRGDCQKDPDMQLDHESWTPIKVVNNELYLSMPLADEELVLIWKKIK